MTARKHKTLYDKIWAAHEVRSGSETMPPLLYVDLHLVHEVSSPQAFTLMRERKLPVFRPQQTLGVIDHATPTLPPDRLGNRPYVSKQTQAQAEMLLKNCKDFGIVSHGWDSPHRGIVHVMAPEMGLVYPGMTVVCGDSHTSTHGAFGALAFGIGTTEVGHVLATQSLMRQKDKNFSITINGRLNEGVTAKDLALYILSKIGFSGGAGHVIEYRGSAIKALGMEARMTLCNMSIEGGARSGLIAPDATTLAWLKGREHAPKGKDWTALERRCDGLCSDDDAEFDKELILEASDISPMVTYGTTPSESIRIDQVVPHPKNQSEHKSLDYMQFEAGNPLVGQAVKTVFIGSCTNARLSDLTLAAQLMKGKTVARGVRVLVVPGSNSVKREAEAASLDRIFLDAGAQWREPGCSMCIAMNGDIGSVEGLTLSTTNRNFKGRQGPNTRTVLCSPAVAAASAITGYITDPRVMSCAGERVDL